MGKSQEQMDLAVKAGYWHLYRYNPMLEAEGKNPFTLDSKEPDWTKFQDFLGSEVRYTSLQKSFPKEAEILFKAAEENAKWRYKAYQRLAAMARAHPIPQRLSNTLALAHQVFDREPGPVALAGADSR